MRRVPRPIMLTESARIWPSVLYQTSTLELHRDGRRLLSDPGASTWEVAEAAGDGVQDILLTHADWDHVLGIGILRDATVHASPLAAERIGSGDARASVESQAPQFYLDFVDLDGLRVDHVVTLPSDEGAGPWAAHYEPSPGHTPDGMTTWFPDENLVVVGDYLSELEIPFVYHSAAAYRETMERLIDRLSEWRPAFVVVGHGPPHDVDTAIRIAHEDHEYVSALEAFVSGGGTLDGVDSVAYPKRSPGDAEAHTTNITKALRPDSA
jgi:glyoxylase-like metal-dependent hydrolase (beta-lactamase superfamily II)